MISFNFNTIGELIGLAEEQHLPMHEIVLAREMHTSQRSRESILQEMQHNWQVMQESIERGIKNTEKSVSGMTGGDAKKIYAYCEKGYMGANVLAAAAYAVGISEVNAVMGRIVACPRLARAALCRQRFMRRKNSAALLMRILSRSC